MYTKNRKLLFALLLISAVAAFGCSRTTTDTATDTSMTDSLVAANPLETPTGDLTPEEVTPPASNPAPAPSTPAPRPRPSTPPRTETPAPSTVGTLVPAGTAFNVTVNTKISTETANEGDAWQGVVKEAIVVDGKTVVPAGAIVSGVVTKAIPAKKGDRATLDLAMRSVGVDGRNYDVSGGTEEIVAGSTRARNLGAIAGGAAAGALIGRAVGGDSKGGVIGGIIGGAAATGAVAASKGYQVVLKEGTDLTFTSTEGVRIRV
jgi:hypothetical protein